jgi:2-methylcitrate dehydratase PrpD
MSASVSDRLVSFLRDFAARGVPDGVLHEAKRLLLNQLKASVAATDHKAIRILSDWAQSSGPGKGAHALWLGTEMAPEHACMVNGALFEVLDFHDTYIPCFMHATSAVLPAVLAQAEVGHHSGRDMLTALALGMEVELAIATMLMPTGYYRGHVPAGLTGGVGAAAACAVLAGLDAEKMRNAIGIAMCTAFGDYVSVGSDTLSYITGATARSGYTAFQLAARGLDAPATAFEGDKGMFVTHADEKPEKISGILDSLGSTWRIFGQTYKTVPTETITHAPVELALQILPRANGRRVERMTLGVAVIVVSICKERMERFGVPNSDLTARFDTCFCTAAAWQRGQFTLAEMAKPAYTDSAILDLRTRIDLVADPSRKTFEGAWLDVKFTDGSTERANVDAFLGTPANRISDQQLSQLFRTSAIPILPDGRASQVLDAVWSLENSGDVMELISSCRIH